MRFYDLTQGITSHILIECNYLTPTRNGFYRARSMRDLFTNTDPGVILSFLKA